VHGFDYFLHACQHLALAHYKPLGLPILRVTFCDPLRPEVSVRDHLQIFEVLSAISLQDNIFFVIRFLLSRNSLLRRIHR
jgi:hypothetical protein